jgi:hypothetical protein
MKGTIDYAKHPIAYAAFWYLIGSTIGWFLGSVVLFCNYIDPTVNLALASTFTVICTLIALTWGEK